jgi:hypothetical protein
LPPSRAELREIVILQMHPPVWRNPPGVNCNGGGLEKRPPLLVDHGEIFRLGAGFARMPKHIEHVPRHEHSDLATATFDGNVHRFDPGETSGSPRFGQRAA